MKEKIEKKNEKEEYLLFIGFLVCFVVAPILLGINDFILKKSNLILIGFLAYFIVPTWIGYTEGRESVWRAYQLGKFEEKNALDRLLNNKKIILFFFFLWIGSFLLLPLFKELLWMVIILTFVFSFILGYSYGKGYR